MRAARGSAPAEHPGGRRFRRRHIADLPDLLRAGDLLVCNDTKVIPARLVGKRGAATVEVTLHRDEGGGMLARLCQGRAPAAPGDRLDFAADFAATVAEKHPEGDLTLRFDIEGEAFRAALARHGAMPLPPYIRRPAAATRATEPTTRRCSHAPRVRSQRLPPGCISPRR